MDNITVFAPHSAVRLMCECNRAGFCLLSCDKQFSIFLADPTTVAATTTITTAAPWMSGVL